MSELSLYTLNEAMMAFLNSINGEIDNNKIVIMAKEINSIEEMESAEWQEGDIGYALNDDLFEEVNTILDEINGEVI